MGAYFWKISLAPGLCHLRSISIVPRLSLFIPSRRLQEYPSSNASNHELLELHILSGTLCTLYLELSTTPIYANSTVNIGPPTPHSTSLQGFRCVTVKQFFFAHFYAFPP
ncbi:hypothetical protein N7530_000390 [Penicillium desertorum]|uniref:Uncharacterized protein n=1 Tax=Penicillium desertorum TaxID=1303715 RepID=A0A9X0BVW3_9EURO|nr:hypothetical protein N7530_000390 [Penicillium desertorum]